MPRKIGLSPNSLPAFNVTLESGEVISDPRAIRAMIALMNQNAVIGGAAAHWGGPSAFTEINCILFSIFFKKPNHPWFEDYNFVNDAGHCENGIYAQHANYGFNDLSLSDLRKFRSIESKLAGHGEGHLYPEGVLVSNGPLGSAISQAQGLCASDKLSNNSRVTIATISDGAIMEGEAKEALSAIPGLAKKNKMNPFVLIISDNNTKLSGRIDKDSFSQEPTFSSLEPLGWTVTHIDNGHDLNALESGITSAISESKRTPHSPQVIVIKTVKGKGVKSTEEMDSGGHGYPLKAYDQKLEEFITEIYNGNEPPKEFNNWIEQIRAQKSNDDNQESEAETIKKQKVQVGVSEALIDLCEKGLPLVSITSDLAGSTGVAPFQKKFPNKTFDIGVAESNMISMASGFSNNGYIPIVDTFAQFGVTKGNLPLIMANINQTPIVAIFSHTGFQDAADGASHQSTTYLSAVSSIPNTKVFNLSCSSQAYQLITDEIELFHEKRSRGETTESLIFFLGRENFPLSYPELNDQGQSEIAIVATGSMVHQAIKAKRKLEHDSIATEIIDLPKISPLDEGALLSKLKDKKVVFTLEDHQIYGGMGSILSLKLGNKLNIKHLGIDGHFGRSAYKADHLYKAARIDADTVVKKVKEYKLNQ